jgi:hypothetical protein
VLAQLRLPLHRGWFQCKCSAEFSASSAQQGENTLTLHCGVLTLTGVHWTSGAAPMALLPPIFWGFDSVFVNLNLGFSHESPVFLPANS